GRYRTVPRLRRHHRLLAVGRVDAAPHLVDALATGVGPAHLPAVDRRGTSSDRDLALETVLPLVDQTERRRAGTRLGRLARRGGRGLGRGRGRGRGLGRGRGRGRGLRGGGRRGRRLRLVRADTRDLAVTTVEDDVGAAVEVLLAVRADPVDEQDGRAGPTARQRLVPVVVVQLAGRARLRRVGNATDRLQVAPRERGGGAPALPRDVDVECTWVVGPVVVPDLDRRARRQVRLRPVVTGGVVRREVV